MRSENSKNVYAEEKEAVLDERIIYGAQPDVMLRAAANDIKQNGEHSIFAAKYGVNTLDDLFRGDANSRRALGQMLGDRGHSYTNIELDKYFFELDLAAKNKHLLESLEGTTTSAVAPALPAILHVAGGLGKVAVDSEGRVCGTEETGISLSRFPWHIEDTQKIYNDVWNVALRQGGGICKQ